MPELEEVLKVTSGKEWRGEREEGRLKRLPSGKVVQLGKIRLRDLMTQGELPNPLMPHVIKMMGGKKWEAESEADVQFLFDLLDFVCIKGFVEPKIVEEPEADDEISVRDVDFEDQLFVFDYVQSEIRFLTPFRPKRGADVAAVSGGEELSEPAEPDSGAGGG